MHQSAYSNAQKFFNVYCKENIEFKSVLDVGSCDVNGTMKPIFTSCKQYVGIDQCEGKNVDLVCVSHKIPLEDNSFDIIISSSCFEHDPMFWITFKEMCRIVKNGGYIYVQAPSKGPYHAYPIDNWRFYIDSWKCLEQWSNYINYPVKLIESYIDKTDDLWHDSVGIYQK